MRPKSTLSSLDGLRFLAAMMVVLYHYFYFGWNDLPQNDGIGALVHASQAYPGMVAGTWWGWVGVQIFFVISGFVIVMSADGKGAAAFAVGRFRRLFPALAFFSMTGAAVLLLAEVVTVAEVLPRLARTLVLFPQGPWIDGAVWTLTVEAVFYGLVFVCLALGAGHRMERIAEVATLALAAVWLVLALHAAVGLGRLGETVDAVARSYAARVVLLTTGQYFLFGIFAYFVHARGATRRRLVLGALNAAMCLGGIVLTASMHSGVVTFGHSPLVPAAVWAAVMLLVGLSLALERRTAIGPATARVVRLLGLMTYPLYLVNQITGAALLGMLGRAGLDRWTAATATIVAIAAASLAFATLVEPLLRRLLAPRALDRLADRGLRIPVAVPAASVPADVARA